jgi:hypothetical protein
MNAHETIGSGEILGKMLDKDSGVRYNASNRDW